VIKFVKGNLFDTDAEAIVNTVNCVGVMGKGIALHVKKRYPNVFQEYKIMCDNKELKPGIMQTVSTGNLLGIQYVVNFPTKRHWKARSKIEDIELGLNALVKEINRMNIKSIALPPLGCGNGGLDWNDVKPLIVNSFNYLDNVEAKVYEPSNFVESKVDLYSNTDLFTIETKPKLTEGRKDLLSLLLAYTKETFTISVNEIHNLAFILQTTGHTLNLNFTPCSNGLISEGLNLVLSKLNNHYLIACSQPNKTSIIRVIEDEFKNHLNQDNSPMCSASIENVIQSIEGYRSEAGLELYSKVVWEARKTNDLNTIIKNVMDWETENRILYKEADIKSVYSHLISSPYFTFSNM